MDLVFQIFGSKSSQDMDCMCFVDEIPSTQESHELCSLYDAEIGRITGTDREVNSNLAIVKDGIIVETFKGTTEECNNSLMFTYELHTQYHPQQILHFVERDVELKVLRTCRVILSFWSRSTYRKDIKEALRGDVYKKMEVINKINATEIKDLQKNVDFTDYLKVMAFQLGQTLALLEGQELYTKEDIAEYYPDLEKYLMREEVDSLQVIEDYKVELMRKLSKFEFVNTKEIL